MAWLSSILFLTLGISLCSSAILESITDLDQLNLEFDFIVVGGGTAGNVVANRLSEDPDRSVLVLEAGGSNADVLDIIVPFYGTRATPNTPQDWNFTTTPQAGLNGRSLAYNRGFVLGGSSSVNYMVYTRGSKEDFDRWAKVTGDDGCVSLAGFPSPVDSRVIETTTELEEFPFNLDMNSGYQLGIGWGQATIKNGSRSSSATSYLAPQFVARPNLHVLLHARVTRVLPTISNTFRTVEFVQDLDGKRFTLTAKKEIILSAGSIGTPNILLNSGIGNSSTLTSLGIKPVHNLPSVGQNLSDHSLLFFSFLVNSNDTFETAERNTTLAADQFAQWNTSRTGPLVDNPLSHMGWLRIPDNSSIFEKFPDPAAGPNTSHYELIISNGMLVPPPPTGNFLNTFDLTPLPGGSVTLNSSDPLADPLINPNILGSEVDVVIMREASYVISPFERWTVYHPVGTAGMSPKGATWGVVDPDLSVKGLTGLRIVDLSVVPFIPAAHTQAAAYIIGERASDLIRILK
ncbi:aryl-alcohol oxidase [Mycena leptocephala]|nr:aryl-alcohol oxidase [Mycena leptocephala]